MAYGLPTVSSGITTGNPWYTPSAGAGAAGLGAAGGMPWLWPLLLSFGPGLLARLFGGNSNAILRQRVQQLTSPQNVNLLTGKFYNQALGSPAYSQALGTIAAGANESGNQMAQKLGSAGIGNTGTGAVLSSLVPSLIGSQRAGLQTQAYGFGQSQAQNYINEQLKALYGTQGPSYQGQLFGAGLAGFGPYLQAWLRQRYPNSFGTMPWSGYGNNANGGGGSYQTAGGGWGGQ